MNPIIKDLRNLELKVAGRLTEVEQLELHNLISCAEQRISDLQELNNKRWEN